MGKSSSRLAGNWNSKVRAHISSHKQAAEGANREGCESLGSLKPTSSDTVPPTRLPTLLNSPTNRYSNAWEYGNSPLQQHLSCTYPGMKTTHQSFSIGPFGWHMQWRTLTPGQSVLTWYVLNLCLWSGGQTSWHYPRDKSGRYTWGKRTLDVQNSSWHTGDRVMEEKRWPSWTKHAHLSQGERPHQVFTELTIQKPRWPKPSVQLSWARRCSVCNSDRQRLVHNFLSSSRENPCLRSELPKFTHDRARSSLTWLLRGSSSPLGQPSPLMALFFYPGSSEANSLLLAYFTVVSAGPATPILLCLSPRQENC